MLSTETRAGRIFDLSIQFAILVSVVSFSIETLPDLSARTRWVLRTIEVITVGVFSVEYVLRIACSERPVRFVFSIWGAIDLLAILPFYLSTSIDLRTLRVVRLLRVLRMLKIFRYNRAIDRLKRAVHSISAELLVFVLLSLMTIYIASVGIYYLERDVQPDTFSSIFAAMWWSLITLSTVGYGDVYPITVGGRVFTAVVLFVGLGLVAVPSGLFAAALSNSVRTDDMVGESEEL